MAILSALIKIDIVLFGDDTGGYLSVHAASWIAMRNIRM
jgi:hypothetical protein